MIQKNEQQGPPDLEDVFKKFTGKSKSRKNTDSNKDSNEANRSILRLFIVIIGILIVVWALSGIFIVKPAERAAVLRFGRYQTTVGPGPHWYPRFVESIQTVNVKQVSAIKLDSLMLTKKENIVSVQFVVQYRIGDLQHYLFNVADPVNTLSQSLDSAVRQVIGHSTLDRILTTGRAEIADQVRTQLVKLMSHYKTGIYVVGVTMQPATAPEEVKAAFDDVIKAREDKVRLGNEATSYANSVVPIAKGQAVRFLQQSRAASSQVVSQAKAKVASFKALLPQYKASPKVTEERLYLQAMENIYSHNQVVVADKGSNNVIYLPLDRAVSLKTVQTEPVSAQAPAIKAPEPAQVAKTDTSKGSPSDMMRKLAYMRFAEAQQ